MRAHQIIYTSCRRGIEGVSDGLQVFSYDAALPAAGFDAGPSFRRLLPFDVPEGVGATAFGYAPVEGVGAVWACNTKLPYDYMGPAGRAGNVLRHAVAAPLEAAGFHPVELAGAAFWRRSMEPGEVNVDAPPAFLPPVELAPAGLVDEASVGRWLAGRGAQRAAAKLARAAVLAAEEGRVLAVLAEPDEALFWVAAATYALPLALAARLGFVVGCDNLAAGATLCGIGPEAFFCRVPAYARDACLAFDPRSGTVADGAGAEPFADGEGAAGAPGTVPVAGGSSGGAAAGGIAGAAFQDAVERGWRAGPEGLAAFRAFCSRSLDLRLSLADLDAAVAAQQLVERGLADVADAGATLAFVAQRGSEPLRRLALRAALEELGSLGAEGDAAALSYALAMWARADAEARRQACAALAELAARPERAAAFLDALACCFAAQQAGAGAGFGGGVSGGAAGFGGAAGTAFGGGPGGAGAASGVGVGPGAAPRRGLFASRGAGHAPSDGRAHEGGGRLARRQKPPKPTKRKGEAGRAGGGFPFGKGRWG